MFLCEPPWDPPGTLQYSNVVNIVSNALKRTFSSVHSSLVVIHRFARTNWSCHSSFRGLIVVQGHTECALSLTSHICTAVWGRVFPVHGGHLHLWPWVLGLTYAILWPSDCVLFLWRIWRNTHCYHSLNGFLMKQRILLGLEPMHITES
jgi:hypothetical protein